MNCPAFLPFKKSITVPNGLVIDGLLTLVSNNLVAPLTVKISSGGFLSITLPLINALFPGDTFKTTFSIPFVVFPRTLNILPSV